MLGEIPAIETPAPTPPSPTAPADGNTAELSAAQVLELADRLVSSRRFAEAQPLLAALSSAGKYPAEVDFLEGYVAVEQGDPKQAEKLFRKTLVLRPDLVRARLELARTLSLQGRDQDADYHYRLAQAAKLPPEVAQAVNAARQLIRDRNRVGVSFTLGIAPDSNANSGTSESTIDLVLGDQHIPAQLSKDARKESAVGVTAGTSLRLRRSMAETWGVVVEGAAQTSYYDNKAPTDTQGALAAGPEVRLARDLRLAVLATGNVRVRDDDLAQKSAGIRATLDRTRSRSLSLISLEAQRNSYPDNSLYNGSRVTALAAHQRALSRSMAGAISLRGDWSKTRDPAYGTREFGVSVDLAKELPRGVNVGTSLNLSELRGTQPLPLLSTEPRRDTRFSLRGYVGLRSVAFKGFSPTVSYSYTKARSNIPLYSFVRHRLAVEITRFF